MVDNGRGQTSTEAFGWVSTGCHRRFVDLSNLRAFEVLCCNQNTGKEKTITVRVKLVSLTAYERVGKTIKRKNHFRFLDYGGLKRFSAFSDKDTGHIKAIDNLHYKIRIQTFLKRGNKQNVCVCVCVCVCVSVCLCVCVFWEGNCWLFICSLYLLIYIFPL